MARTRGRARPRTQRVLGAASRAIAPPDLSFRRWATGPMGQGGRERGAGRAGPAAAKHAAPAPSDAGARAGRGPDRPGQGLLPRRRLTLRPAGVAPHPAAGGEVGPRFVRPGRDLRRTPRPTPRRWRGRRPAPRGRQRPRARRAPSGVALRSRPSRPGEPGHRTGRPGSLRGCIATGRASGAAGGGAARGSRPWPPRPACPASACCPTGRPASPRCCR
jgi:hypothetical protein